MVIIQSAKLTESEQKEVIIQSAELTESEQTKVCSEAHNLQANWRKLKFVPKRTIPAGSAQLCMRRVSGAECSGGENDQKSSE